MNALFFQAWVLFFFGVAFMLFSTSMIIYDWMRPKAVKLHHEPEHGSPVEKLLNAVVETTTAAGDHL